MGEDIGENEAGSSQSSTSLRSPPPAGGPSRTPSQASRGLKPAALSEDVLGKLCASMPGLAEALVPKKAGMASPPDAVSAASPKPASSVMGTTSASSTSPCVFAESVAVAGPQPIRPPVLRSSGPLQVGLVRTPAVAPGPSPVRASTPLPQAGLTTIVVPGVKELCADFKIDEQVALLLDAQLRKRPLTYDGDVETLREDLKAAKSPAACLMVKIKELQQGNFVGKPPNYKEIQEVAKKYMLDEQATLKLTDVLTKRGKEKGLVALEQLEKHLARSNKPSALVMLFLAKLRKGEDIGEPTHGPAPGSWAYEEKAREMKAKEEAEREEKERRTRERSRDRRDRGGGRARDNDRGRGWEYDRDRNGDRGSRREDDYAHMGGRDQIDRDRGRGTDRGREGGRDYDRRYVDRGQAIDHTRDRDRGRDYDRARDRVDVRDSYERHDRHGGGRISESYGYGQARRSRSRGGGRS